MLSDSQGFRIAILILDNFRNRDSREMIKSIKPIAVALMLSSVSLFSSDRPVDSQAIALSSEQQAALKALNIPVAVPTYVPPGFIVSQIKFNFCSDSAPQSGDCRAGSSYEIIYRTQDNTCLVLDAIGGGLGGPDSEFHYPIQTDIFGEVEIRFGEIPGDGNTPTAEQLQMPQSGLYSFPARSRSMPSAYYAVRVEEERYSCGRNITISPLDVESIFKSLVWLE